MQMLNYFLHRWREKKDANSVFFYDFVVDDQGKLIYIFWAGATSRKNYSHFGYVDTFDATYSTNQYNIKFAPFTGINYHMQSVFLEGAFIVNEKIESYEWLFKTFLLAMGGKDSRLIITDEDGSCFLGTIHRFCMWHIIEKMSEMVGHPTNRDPQFWTDLNKCVWDSEIGQVVAARDQCFVVHIM
jgi:zinc finger SWIM domain-containing protein 3